MSKPSKPKPLGPIPSGFDMIDGELAIGGKSASQLVADAGRTPLFAYCKDRLDARIAELRATMPKRLSVLNCESEGEAQRTLEIGETIGVTPRIAFRVNPEFELRGSGMKMGGGAKPFGIDTDRVPALAQSVIKAGAEYRGLHIFTGSQALDSEALIETQDNVLTLADKLSQEIGVNCPKLNMGGGFGIPYFDAQGRCGRHRRRILCWSLWCQREPSQLPWPRPRG